MADQENNDKYLNEELEEYINSYSNVMSGGSDEIKGDKDHDKNNYYMTIWSNCNNILSKINDEEELRKKFNLPNREFLKMALIFNANEMTRPDSIEEVDLLTYLKPISQLVEVDAGQNDREYKMRFISKMLLSMQSKLFSIGDMDEETLGKIYDANVSLLQETARSLTENFPDELKDALDNLEQSYAERKLDFKEKAMPEQNESHEGQEPLDEGETSIGFRESYKVELPRTDRQVRQNALPMEIVSLGCDRRNRDYG